MTTTHLRTWRRSARTLAGWASAIALTALVVACNDLRNALNVTAPDKIDTGALRTPANAQLLVNSTQGDFECAWGAFVVDGGFLSGELMDATLTAARYTLPKRAVDPSETFYSLGECDGLGVYTPISRARYTADTTLTLLKGWTAAQVPGRDTLIARAAIYAGYDYIMLGELFCSAAVDVGPEQSSNQLFALAEDRFTQALAAANTIGSDSLKAIAYAGRARARLDKGDAAGADADAKAVLQLDPNFVFLAKADAATSIRTNRVYAQQNGLAVSVDTAFRGLTLQTVGGGTVPDPRTIVTDVGRPGGDRTTEVWITNKYPTASTPFVVSSWQEMDLIIAEVEGGSTAANIITTLRQAVVPNAAPYNGGGSVKDTVIAERERQLFLQGSHQYDVRRFNGTPNQIQLLHKAGDPYPHGGGTYGSQVCLPIPDVETLNNPNFTGNG